MNKAENDWWKHGVIYQIYPRSFQDSDGDGTGDLPGIISRLDYLQWLGIDAIWLSPVFPSPMLDFGYDIRDYRNIDPVFGNLNDFDRLVEEAHQRNIKIILDLVLNHSSSSHAWFQESRKSADGDKADWYIWHPGKKFLVFRRPPNNWRAAFGGRAWTWDSQRKSYYLHLFLKEQPDFNWRNPELREELLNIARYWLERGADGFRLDVINYIVKDTQFRSNPYRLRKAPPRLHDQQDHRFDRNQAESHTYLRELRRVMDEYDGSMLVGEVYPNEGVSEPRYPAEYQGNGNDELHMAFNFSFMFTGFSAAEFHEKLAEWYGVLGEERWPCHVFSNHDQSRAMTRLCGHDRAKAALLAGIALTQKGTPFLYYGEEIGMRDGRIHRTQLQDPLGKKYWPFHPGRDPERTPMQWNGDSHAGFSTAEPWLPVNSDHTAVHVEGQKADPGSLLNWYRKLLALRRSTAALHGGSIVFPPLKTGNNVLAYFRLDGQQCYLAAGNFSDRTHTVDRISFPREFRNAGFRKILGSASFLSSSGEAASLNSDESPAPILAPYEFALYEIKT